MKFNEECKYLKKLLIIFLAKPSNKTFSHGNTYCHLRVRVQ